MTTETSFQRANRLADEAKRTHDVRAAADVRSRLEGRRRQSLIETRASSRWWQDWNLWTNQGWSASGLEFDVIEEIKFETESIHLRALEAAKPKPVKVVKPWKPLGEIHIEHLLTLIVMGSEAESVAIFAPNDLTESVLALG